MRENNSQNKLWYRQPARNWVEALPIGNGRLGAMIFGGVLEERIQFNCRKSEQTGQESGIKIGGFNVVVCSSSLS